jgi:hypothetical protein
VYPENQERDAMPSHAMHNNNGVWAIFIRPDCHGWRVRRSKDIQENECFKTAGQIAGSSQTTTRIGMMFDFTQITARNSVMFWANTIAADLWMRERYATDARFTLNFPTSSFCFR